MTTAPPVTPGTTAAFLPEPGTDAGWTLECSTGGVLGEAVVAALDTIGSGGVATRGPVTTDGAADAGLVLCAGVYDGTGEAEHLLPGPSWTVLDVAPVVAPAPGATRSVLDLRAGVLATAEADGRVRTVSFASAGRPGVVALRAEGPAGVLRGGAPLRRPEGATYREGRSGDRLWARTVGTRAGRAASGIAAVAVQHERVRDGTVRVERMAAYTGDPRRTPGVAGALDLLDDAAAAGFGRLLDEQRAAWARRWRDTGVELPDDPATERALRFALFQLWCNTDRRSDLAVGARGLSGRGYSGHVFWDADVFVLPAMTTVCPAVASAMVDYRLRRLDAARARARAAGLAGARFPWESASTGEDVTPTAMVVNGVVRPVHTGPLEEHVTADIAWAACNHARWTGGSVPPELLRDTARYWASRIRRDGDRAHLDGVEGPDEYHSGVDDNAFTNGMARWNLRAAARSRGVRVPGAERRRWHELADGLVDGYDAGTGRYEQFRGYFALEPLTMAMIAPPPIAADLLLGPERVAGSQLIKQPDVLMLHHLVPDETRPGSLAPNLDFYGPRTAHGSSLSPAVTAALLARAGRPDEALAMLRLAADIDLADAAGSGSGGLHLANLGGMWQALVHGFLGASIGAAPGGDVLVLDPCLPAAWTRLGARFRALGRRVSVSIEGDRLDVSADGPLRYRPGRDADPCDARITPLEGP